MAGYISLFKYTEKGMSDIKSLPDQIGKAKQLFEKMGVRLVGVWLTMGQYDGVAVFDAPDDQTMAAVLMAQEMQGLSATHTMRAFSEDEIAQIIKRLA
ncbi:MAG: GYD domain-containing protein [Chloroflexi bacterium]|nr:GYD domain-containing protein [Chloroflexota bacterium]